MKAYVDKDACIGCSLCASLCPKVFSMNQDGLAEASEDPIDEAVKDDVLEAQGQCPVEAIKVKE